MDNAYWMGSFQGKILKRFQADKFCQFLWRPRPPTLLSKKQIKDVKKNLKKYSAAFEAEDVMWTTKASEELIEKRRSKYAEFREYRERREEDYASQRDQRLALRDGVDTDDVEVTNTDLEEEVVEFLVKEEQSIME